MIWTAFDSGHWYIYHFPSPLQLAVSRVRAYDRLQLWWGVRMVVKDYARVSWSTWPLRVCWSMCEAKPWFVWISRFQSLFSILSCITSLRFDVFALLMLMITFTAILSVPNCPPIQWSFTHLTPGARWWLVRLFSAIGKRIASVANSAQGPQNCCVTSQSLLFNGPLTHSCGPIVGGNSFSRIVVLT